MIIISAKCKGAGRPAPFLMPHVIEGLLMQVSLQDLKYLQSLGLESPGVSTRSKILAKIGACGRKCLYRI